MRSVCLLRAIFLVTSIVFWTGCDPNTDPEYYEEGDTFSFYILEPYEPSILRDTTHVTGLFLSRSNDLYTFFDSTHHDTLRLQVNGVNQALPLKVGTTYRMYIEVAAGWPMSYGLYIQSRNSDTMIFAGVSDIGVNERIKVVELLPITVRKVRTLRDHFKVISICRNRFTNIELAFHYQSEEVLLLQGQSEDLLDWQISIGLARDVKYSGDCVDDGVNEVSYTFIHTNTE